MMVRGQASYYTETEAQDAMSVVAGWIGRNRGIKVQYHGGTVVDADIRKGIVRIPRLACASGITQEALMLLRHRVYHESGHISETDVDKPAGALGEIMNALEDRRMEAVTADKHKGCEYVFRWGNEWYNRDIAGKAIEGKINAPLWEALVAMGFMSDGMQPLWEPSKKASAYIKAAYDEFAKVRLCRSARECRDLAEKILALLKDANEQYKKENPPQPQGPGQPQEQPKQDGEPQEQDGEPQAGGQGDLDEEESESKSQKSKSKSKSKEDSEDESDEDKSSGSGSGDSEPDEDEGEDESDGGSDGKGDDEEGENKDGKGDEDDEEDGDESEGSSEGDEEDGDEQDNSSADDSDESDTGDDSDSSEGKPEPGSDDGDYNPDDSLHGKDGKDGEGEKDDEWNDTNLEDELDGESREEAINEAIKEYFDELDPKDTEYLSRRDLDEHTIPVTHDGDKEEFKNEREMVAVMVASMTRALEQALRSLSRCRRVGYLPQGRIDRKRLTAIAKGLSKEVFYKVRDGQHMEVAVEIIIDESGSMGNYMAVRLLAIIIGEALNAIGVPFEITGTTTKFGWGGYSMPPLDGMTRTNPICYQHYVQFGETWDAVRHRLVHTGHHNNNIDGEAVEYCVFRLLQRPERRKVVFSLSDGEPCGGQGNDSALGVNIKRVCARARKQGVEVYGFGIQTRAPAMFYGEKNFVYLDNPTTMSQQFLVKLAEVVTGGQVRV